MVRLLLQIEIILINLIPLLNWKITLFISRCPGFPMQSAIFVAPSERTVNLGSNSHLNVAALHTRSRLSWGDVTRTTGRSLFTVLPWKWQVSWELLLRRMTPSATDSRLTRWKRSLRKPNVLLTSNVRHLCLIRLIFKRRILVVCDDCFWVTFVLTSVMLQRKYGWDNKFLNLLFDFRKTDSFETSALCVRLRESQLKRMHRKAEPNSTLGVSVCIEVFVKRELTAIHNLCNRPLLG